MCSEENSAFVRPWGSYRVTASGDGWQTKIIRIRPGCRVSLQSHKWREERWVIIAGSGIVQLDDKFVQAARGDIFTVPVGCKHRLTNTGDREELVFSEVQLGDYLGEDDIVRYEDSYGREG